MKLPCFDDILHRVGLMRKKEVDRTIAALRRMANNDARLNATLAEECRRLQEDNDQLSDENARLIQDNEEAAAQIRSAMHTAGIHEKEVRAMVDLLHKVSRILTQSENTEEAIKAIIDFWDEEEEKYWNLGYDETNDD